MPILPIIEKLELYMSLLKNDFGPSQGILQTGTTKSEPLFIKHTLNIGQQLRFVLYVHFVDMKVQHANKHE